MLERLLVAVDGSDAADRVIALAACLSRAYGSQLIICTAVDRAAEIASASNPDIVFPSVDELLDDLDLAATAVLHAASARAEALGAHATSKLLDGHAAEAIVTCADESSVDAIVIGTRGRGGLERVFLGSTAENVLRRAAVPVFIVPPGAEPAPAVQTAAARAPAPCILVALDDSDASSRALDFALDLALGGHARVICCSAIDTLDLRGEIGDYANDLATVVQEMTREAAALIDTKTARAAERGIALEKLVVEGSTVEAILDAAKAHRAGLIALGTHGRHGLQRLFLGSVAEHIVRRSPIPVVAVRVP